MSDKPKLDLTKPIMHRNGKKVEFIRLLKGSSARTILAITVHADGSENVDTYLLDGSKFSSGGEHDYDLVNVPEKRTVWVYEACDSLPNGQFSLAIRSDRSNTLDNCCRSRIRVEFEAGRKDE